MARERKNSKRTIFNLKIELYEWIREAAFEDRVSMSQKVNECLESIKNNSELKPCTTKK